MEVAWPPSNPWNPWKIYSPKICSLKKPMNMPMTSSGNTYIYNIWSWNSKLIHIYIYNNLGKFDHDRSMFSRSLESWLIREIIPFYGCQIPVSEIVWPRIMEILKKSNYVNEWFEIPSGKHLQFANWKITIFQWWLNERKMAMFNSKLLVITSGISSMNYEFRPVYVLSLTGWCPRSIAKLARLQLQFHYGL
jgi:hypothetical protein